MHKLKNFCPVVGFTKQPIGGPGQVGVQFEFNFYQEGWSSYTKVLVVGTFISFGNF